MYEQSISQKSLSALLRRADYSGIPSGHKTAHGASAVVKALEVAKSGFTSYPLKSWVLRGKAHFSPVDIGHALLLRHISKNLSASLQGRSSGRNSIVSNLRHLIGEGAPYRIYRLDVKSFYESFSTEFLRKTMSDVVALSPITRSLCFQLLDKQAHAGFPGVPRGLAASAVISEIAMRNFDEKISAQREVFFFARFVDDIVILTSGKEVKKVFFDSLEESLPEGLIFSDDSHKKYVDEFEFVSKKGDLSKVIRFDYLGYSFLARNASISDSKGGLRDINVSISPAKLARLKTRVVRAFLDHLKNKDDRLLKDRLRLLTSNFSIYNSGSGVFNSAGIYYSYPHIDFPSAELVELDSFLKQLILSKSGKIYGKIGASLGASLRRSLLSYSFVRGFEGKIFCSFTGNRLKLLRACWKY